MTLNIFGKSILFSKSYYLRKIRGFEVYNIVVFMSVMFFFFYIHLRKCGFVSDFVIDKSLKITNRYILLIQKVIKVTDINQPVKFIS